MAITLAQVDAALDAAFAAINVGELSFATPGGRTVTFNSPTEMQQHIDWLQAMHNRLTQQGDVDAGEGGAPVVAYEEPN